MPVVIGSRPPAGIDDPIGWLIDCHRRVESFMSVLVKAGQMGGRTLTAEERLALESALRYFREAAPKHTEDEEESLFPRLRTLAAPEAEAVLAGMEALEREHRLAEGMHDELDNLGSRWLGAGVLSEQEAGRFRRLAEELAALYQGHIAREEEQVFPAAALLDATQRKAIGEEMAARRGLETGKSD